METSTPISTRRETVMIEMDEDSPLGENQSSASSGMSVYTDEKIPDVKKKAGMSNELNSMIMTPEKELSPNTMDQKLALHCMDIASASVGNSLVEELKYERIHALEVANNSFAKRDGGVINAGQDGDLFGASSGSAMNMIDKPPPFGDVQAVDMDGMNTMTPGGSGRSVGIDGMNKEMKGGVGLLVGGRGRLIKVPGRKLEGQSPKPSPTTRLIFGAKAPQNIMTLRACPVANGD